MLLVTALANESPNDCEFMLQIYDDFNHIMFSTARKYASDSATVEDIVQDSITKLIPKISKLRELKRCALASYVVYTVRNTAKNHLRQMAVKSKHIDSGELSDYENYVSDPTPSPEELLLMAERAYEFRLVWNELPEEDRELLEGKYCHDLDNDELAEIFDCKPDSIRMKLTRAIRRALDKFREGTFSYDQT